MSDGEDEQEHGYRVPGRQPGPSRRPARSGEESDTTVAIDLEPDEIRVDPGGSGTVRLRVRNTSSIVDGIAIEVAGEAAAWASVVPAELRLYPGTEGECVITFRPPRAPQPPAGPLEARISATSRERAGASAQASVLLDIAPYDEMIVALAPRYGSTKREFTSAIKLVNQGNRPVAARISASDPHQALEFAAQPETVSAAPGGESTAWLRMRPRRSSWFGRPQSYPFDVTVAPSPGSPRALDGRLEILPLLPGWVGLAGAALLILAIVGGVACGTGVVDCVPAAVDTPLPTPAITPVPGVTVTPQPATPTPPALTPTPASGQRVVPDVQGRPLFEALTILRREGFTPFQRETSAPGVDTFSVIGTDPPAGSLVDEGSDILVFFAFGP